MMDDSSSAVMIRLDLNNEVVFILSDTLTLTTVLLFSAAFLTVLIPHSLLVKPQNRICLLQHLTLLLRETFLTNIVSCEPHSTLGPNIDILHHKV